MCLHAGNKNWQAEHIEQEVNIKWLNLKFLKKKKIDSGSMMNKSGAEKLQNQRSEKSTLKVILKPTGI